MVQDGISYNAWDKSKSGPYSANGETECNQAQLAYYTSAADNPSGQNTDASNKLRWKVFPFAFSENANIQIDNAPGYRYWTASVIHNYFAGFCAVNYSGDIFSSLMSSNIAGAAPAFCVY
jgi:hypothetical protein